MTADAGRTLEVEVLADTRHTLAVEYEWEIPDGVELTGPVDGPPARLVITVTQLDECPAPPRSGAPEDRQGGGDDG